MTFSEQDFGQASYPNETLLVVHSHSTQVEQSDKNCSWGQNSSVDGRMEGELEIATDTNHARLMYKDSADPS